ncbi:MAG: tRNA 5-methoxyuridine(34)/uridine 5-oxyacetic acid(34) synthase CmoB [Planctomycetes bacterium]|nr:tRNA 5-methoxyuridine(34)/uridine 5-oxyacetic acid(34) synthase CmoB [Planctomycetota bacterium]
MIDYCEFLNRLKSIDELDGFADYISPRITDAWQQLNNGDLSKWQHAVNSLPDVNPSRIDINNDAIAIGYLGDCDDKTRARLKESLMQLHTWRKGPIDFFGIRIDTEWQSYMKWNRLKDKIAPLKDKLILDVGCGNGYYGLRMLSQGAKVVVGIDPHLLFVMQFQAFNKYIKTDAVSVLPFKLEDMPTDTPCFDTAFSMGVLYHRRYPIDHISRLKNLMKPAGQLVLETLVIDTDKDEILKPKKRYAKMPNVWQIPSPSVLVNWLTQAGFRNIEVVDITRTSHAEQRRTQWMQYESLENYIDKNNPNQTVEGYPPPTRAIVLANK